MKKYLPIAVCLIAALIFLIWAQRSGKFNSGNGKSDPQVEASSRLRATEVGGAMLNDCWDDGLGVIFLCDYIWEKKETNANAMFFVVNSDPSVTFKMIKINADILFVRQLNRDKLKSIGQYNDGFMTEEAEVAGFKAIKVKAFARDDHDTRLLDYYFVRNKNLYAVMFLVTPKEKWDNYKFVFQKIVSSLKFKP